MSARRLPAFLGSLLFACADPPKPAEPAAPSPQSTGSETPVVMLAAFNSRWPCKPAPKITRQQQRYVDQLEASGQLDLIERAERLREDLCARANADAGVP